uniref:Uncharacterized protein n=1 Tax=Hyaloperonospora arabidopsidis (strain Emoy2) TaxID=559515 RepID=M4BVK1_HYAAE
MNSALAFCGLVHGSTWWSWAAVLLFVIISVTGLQMRCNWIITCKCSKRVRHFKRKRARPDEG